MTDDDDNIERKMPRMTKQPKSSTYLYTPDIKQNYSKSLLRTPIPKDDRKKLWKTYLYIQENLFKKSNYNPRWHEKCMKLKEEFLELYERIKEKEKEQEGKNGYENQKPFYRIRGIDKRNKTVFDRLREKRIKFKYFGKDSEIQ